MCSVEKQRQVTNRFIKEYGSVISCQGGGGGLRSVGKKCFGGADASSFLLQKDVLSVLTSDEKSDRREQFERKSVQSCDFFHFLSVALNFSSFCITPPTAKKPCEDFLSWKVEGRGGQWMKKVLCKFQKTQNPV